jgi:hypothetical protein
MRKIYFFVIACFLLTACSKDAFRKYDKRIVGTWRLVDVDRAGIGGSLSHLDFIEGEFKFENDGHLTYTDDGGNVFNGTWDIRREWKRGGCSTDNDGNTHCDDRQVSALFLTAVNFNSQDIRTEHFDEMDFTGTNRFKAYVNSGWHTYIFRFRR